jgi:peptidoglycan hydrolase FlgJ
MSAVGPIEGAKVSAAVDPGLRKAAQQFEAIFLRQMIASMRQARLSEDVLGSSATDNFVELADARTAESVAALGRFGIAAMIEKQLSGKGAAG